MGAQWAVELAPGANAEAIAQNLGIIVINANRNRF